jgi:hypothetical protein
MGGAGGRLEVAGQRARPRISSGAGGGPAEGPGGCGTTRQGLEPRLTWSHTTRGRSAVWASLGTAAARCSWLWATGLKFGRALWARFEQVDATACVLVMGGREGCGGGCRGSSRTFAAMSPAPRTSGHLPVRPATFFQPFVNCCRACPGRSRPPLRGGARARSGGGERGAPAWRSGRETAGARRGSSTRWRVRGSPRERAAGERRDGRG